MKKQLNNKVYSEDCKLKCEWKNCSQIFQEKNLLCDHIIFHISDLKSVKDKYLCPWCKCHFVTTCNVQIARHLYYHVYHTILKLEGRKVMHNSNVPSCKNGSKNINKLPELPYDFICGWGECKKTFVSIILFHMHVHKHCNFEFESSRCPDIKKPIVLCNWGNCSKKFSVKYRLQEHLRKHTNEKIIACHICGSAFRTKTVLMDHCKRQLANNTQEFQCGQCYKFFATERLLRLHIIVHVNCFKCSMCDMTCNSSFTLASHIRHRHMLEKPFKCSLCGHKCVTKSDLRRHVSSRHENKTYECDAIGCNYIVKSRHRLRKHFSEIHNNNPVIYSCHCCKNVYNSGKALSQHLIKVHSFQLPSGHKRFTYCVDENGIYHLQTMRIESFEVTKQILSPYQNFESSENIEKVNICERLQNGEEKDIQNELFSIKVLSP